MKKFSLFLFIIIFLYSCSNVPYFANDEFGNLIDAENDRLYIFSRGYLRAAEIIATPFARYDNYGTRATLHEIPGADPAKWLSEDISTLGMPFLFRESSIPEPQLETFGTERIHITQMGERNMRVGLIDNPEQVQAIVDDFVHGDQVSHQINIDRDYMLFFESPYYPGIYFVFNHITSTDGQAYLFDRWTRRTVRCRVPLFGGYSDD